ncbi:Predicted ATPase [Caldanaerobius fijiensis DSM 17918]|uniref:Predicted ATPase n=1 Tax=Caldanaerobius fijiensis DSM 17918 TaxID=1121256 RepID=A0A1M4T3R1_9THEO|nr:AAA family ATPase [Caldanaerobius fijiensis]SHE39081.1 Predicted ATPase [Caldanaerobius fijiensis DSM 17918]
MIFLRSIVYKVPDDIDKDGRYPFNIPLINTLNELHFKSPITLFVGENGSGKSTLLEALAAAVGSVTIGGESIKTDDTLQPARELAAHLKLIWNKKTHRGFFLRSEDFFNFCKSLSYQRTEYLKRLKEIDEKYKDSSDYARSLAKAPILTALGEWERYYGKDLNAYSHGESFFKLFQSRFAPDGLYILDEPETPLSPMNQLTLVSMIKHMAQNYNSQFIIATHSPVLMALPDATIYDCDQIPLKEVRYEELEHINFMRAFLNNPEQFLRHL